MEPVEESVSRGYLNLLT